MDIIEATARVRRANLQRDTYSNLSMLIGLVIGCIIAALDFDTPTTLGLIVVGVGIVLLPVHVLNYRCKQAAKAHPLYYLAMIKKEFG